MRLGLARGLLGLLILSVTLTSSAQSLRPGAPDSIVD